MSRRTPAAAAVVTVVAGGAVLWRRMAPAEPGRAAAAADPPDPQPATGLAGALAAWVPAPPRTAAGRIAVYVWAAPLTLVGGALGVLSGGRPRRVDGAVVFSGSGGPMGAVLRRRGFSGTTLGHAIIVTPSEPSAALLAHELVHTRQAERLGVAFGPVYVALLARYGYERHPMERAARRGAGQAPRTT